MASESSTNKVSITAKSKQSRGWRLLSQKTRTRKLRNGFVHSEDKDEPSGFDLDNSSRQIIASIMGAMAGHQWQPREIPTAEDIELLNKTVHSIHEACEQGILSDEESEAVVRFIVGRFVERRMSSFLGELVPGSNSQWYLAFANKGFENE